MFYVEKDNEIKLFDIDRNRLKNTLLFTPQYSDCEIQETRENETIIDFQLVTLKQAEEIENRKEQERINNLTITQEEFWNKLLPIERKDVEERIKQIPELYKKILIDMDNQVYKYNSLCVQVISTLYEIDLNTLFNV